MKPLYLWKTKSPCWQCTKRYVGCHGNCRDDEIYHEELAIEKEQKRRQEEAGNQVDAIFIQGKIKTRKRNGWNYKRGH